MDVLLCVKVSQRAELSFHGCKDMKKKNTMQEQNFYKKIWIFLTL